MGKNVGEAEYATDKEIEVARAEYQSDDIEIDDGAEVSRAMEDDGCWVAAWVWVSAEIMGEHE